MKDLDHSGPVEEAIVKSKTVRFRAITIDQLRAAYACNSQVRVFRRLFGTKVNVTEKRCLRVAQDLNFSWALRHLIPFESKARARALDLLNAAETRKMSYAAFRRRAAVLFARAYLASK